MSDDSDDTPGTLYVPPETYAVAVENCRGTKIKVVLDETLGPHAWRLVQEKRVSVRVKETDA